MISSKLDSRTRLPTGLRAARDNSASAVSNVQSAIRRSLKSGISKTNSHGPCFERRPTSSGNRGAAAVRFATTRIRDGSHCNRPIRTTARADPDRAGLGVAPSKSVRDRDLDVIVELDHERQRAQRLLVGGDAALSERQGHLRPPRLVSQRLVDLAKVILEDELPELVAQLFQRAVPGNGQRYVTERHRVDATVIVDVDEVLDVQHQTWIARHQFARRLRAALVDGHELGEPATERPLIARDGRPSSHPNHSQHEDTLRPGGFGATKSPASPAGNVASTAVCDAALDGDSRRDGDGTGRCFHVEKL